MWNEREGERESHAHMRALRGGVCLLYRGTQQDESSVGEPSDKLSLGTTVYKPFDLISLSY